jgi:hypothetical protein
MANKKTEAKTTEKAATKEVTFNKYVKYGETSYPAGEKVEVNAEDYDALVEAGVIEE